MKKLMLLAGLALAITGNSLAQIYQNDSQQIHGLSYAGVINQTFTKTSDGGYALAATEENNGSSQDHIILYKLDANLNYVWHIGFKITQTAWGGVFEAMDIIETRDGGFAIAGKLIVEGQQENGGFLLKIAKLGKNTWDADWLKIYSNTDYTGYTPVMSIYKVEETSQGFILIGRGRNVLEPRGMVIGTDDQGNRLWGRQIYDDQYGTNQSAFLNDIVKINDDEFAIVGTVNTFTIDDADVIVVKIQSNGTITDQRVYERYGKKYGDGQAAFLERGEAITYNEQNNTLVIAGTSTMKEEGHCVKAASRDILLFEVKYDNLSLIWENKHNINADLTFANPTLICSDIIYNANSNSYIICGSIDNNFMDGNVNYNGYIYRVDAAGNGYDLRFYGNGHHNLLFGIENSNTQGVAVAGFTFEGSKNNAWVIESYDNILEECQSRWHSPITLPYKLQEDYGLVKKARAYVLEDTAIAWIPLHDNLLLCESLLVGKAQLESEEEAPVISQDINDPGMITIQNDSEYTSYSIYALDGKRMVESTPLGQGIITQQISNYQPGMYLIVFQKSDGSSRTEKIILH